MAFFHFSLLPLRAAVVLSPKLDGVACFIMFSLHVQSGIVCLAPAPNLLQKPASKFATERNAIISSLTLLFTLSSFSFFVYVYIYAVDKLSSLSFLFVSNANVLLFLQ
jgi:hypothetical protein